MYFRIFLQGNPTDKRIKEAKKLININSSKKIIYELDNGAVIHAEVPGGFGKLLADGLAKIGVEFELMKEGWR